MSNPPTTQRSSLTVNVRDEPLLLPTFRLALNQQLDTVVTDLETAYVRSRTTTAHPARPVNISINIGYSISELLPPNTTATAHAQPIPPNQIHVIGSGNLRVNVEIGRVATPAPAPNRDEPQELFDAAAARSLGSLPTVDVNELPEDRKTCPVCTEAFSNGGGEDDDRPVMLKCGHVVGRKCIEQWVLSRHNSCPLCRAAIFEPGELR